MIRENYMKKVAFITPTFPVLSETFIRTEVDAINACGHDVCVMTFKKNKTNDAFNYAVYKVGDVFNTKLLRRLSPRKLIDCLAFIYAQKSMPKVSLFWYSFKMASQMAKHNIQHIHAHFAQHTCSHGIASAKLMGISCSFVAHGHDVYEFPFDLDVKIKHSDFVIAVCNDMRDDFKKIADGNIKLLHCGVKTQFFVPHKKQEQDQIKLIFIGRLVEQKGVKYLLDALKPLCGHYPITLDIIGNGELLKPLKEQVAQLGLAPNVRFLGAKQTSWIQENLPFYDCLVAPFCFSQSGCVDTGPVVLKEAMAVGIPVITSNIMGCKEIVTPGTGYLVEQKNALELTEAIKNFVTLPVERRKEMGISARKNVEQNFDALKQAKVLSNWIETHTVKQ
jgi:colanic acid/amylovoran biosynthesis glycosyltransferase